MGSLIGLNLVVFLLWRAKRFEPFLLKYFTASPFKRSSLLDFRCPSPSSLSRIQLNLVQCYCRPLVITVEFIFSVICMFSGHSVIRLFEFSAKNNSLVNLLSICFIDWVLCSFFSGVSLRWWVALDIVSRSSLFGLGVVSSWLSYVFKVLTRTPNISLGAVSFSLSSRWHQNGIRRVVSLARSWHWLVLSVHNIPMLNYRSSSCPSSRSRQTQWAKGVFILRCFNDCFRVSSLLSPLICWARWCVGVFSIIQPTSAVFSSACSWSTFLFSEMIICFCCLVSMWNMDIKCCGNLWRLLFNIGIDYARNGNRFSPHSFDDDDEKEC